MVDKEVLTAKQNEGRYFMYFALYVRAPRETTWLDSQVSVKNLFFLLVWKNGTDLWNAIWESCKKNYITRVQGE